MPDIETRPQQDQPRPQSHHRRRRRRQENSNWVTGNGQNIFYRQSRPPRNSHATASPFPTPLIGPRRTRPQAIHIITYPSGYVPRDLRQDGQRRKSKKSKSKAKGGKDERRRSLTADTLARSGTFVKQATTSTIRPALGRLFSSFAGRDKRAPSPPIDFHSAPTTDGAVATVDTASAVSPVLDRPGEDGAGVPRPTRILPQAHDVIASHAALTPRPLSNETTPSAARVTDSGQHCQRLPHLDNESASSLVTHPHPHLTLTEQISGSENSNLQQSLSLSLSRSTPTAHRQSNRHSYHHPPDRALAHTNTNSCTRPSTDATTVASRHERRHSAIPSFTRTDSRNAPLAGHDRPSRLSWAPSSAMAARISTPPTAFNFPNATSSPQLGYGRNSFMTARAAAKSSASSVVVECPKPVASGSGVTCSVLLAEPNIFLSGFDHRNDNATHRDSATGTALLRGTLRLSVSKNVKIKAVQLKLVGRARTEWPEGIPPLKQDLFEEESLRTQVLTFFNAMYDGFESEYGNQCTYKLKTSSANSSSTNLAASALAAASLNPTGSRGRLTPGSNLTAKDLKRLSLQNAQSRSFGKGDSNLATSTQAKGFKVFYPGTYDYNFELPIDHHQLETTKLQYGSVKWELQATVDRAGAFKPNLHGAKEVSIVRVPDQMSLETTEPISISRRWEDQLHYDIVISGKSFPIGGKIPIAFKLTPLAKVQVHKLKVFVTESVEYWTNDRRVTRKDPGRKILLLEKAAGKPLDPAWASSEMRTVRGGELSPERRREAREMAHQRRLSEARGRRVPAEPLPEPAENLLGDLDLGLESFWGSTEIEANVQIPSCEAMAKNKELRLNPDCSWKNVNVFHWIKIVMRISRIDPEDPTGTKRRHFEISIDSPFTVLNCRATQANTGLPAYAGPNSGPSLQQPTCGCPDATCVATEGSPNSSSASLPGLDVGTEGLPAPPQAAHIAGYSANPANSQALQHRPSLVDPLGIQGQAPPPGPRPMHLLRTPSFNPPAFDEDIAPPPLPRLVTQGLEPAPEHTNLPPFTTPPPRYDVVIGTPSVDGLADYFTRLADYGFPDEDSGSDSDEASPPRILDRSGRVNVLHPRTPGGRMQSRSMEIPRPQVELEASALPLSPRSREETNRTP